MKSLIINDIDDGEKLNMLLEIIGDERDFTLFKDSKYRFNKLKIFITISEVF